MRNMEKKQRLLDSVQELHKDTLDILQMDVTDRASIMSTRDRIQERHVDILGTSSSIRGRNHWSGLDSQIKTLLCDTVNC